MGSMLKAPRNNRASYQNLTCRRNEERKDIGRNMQYAINASQNQKPLHRHHVLSVMAFDLSRRRIKAPVISSGLFLHHSRRVHLVLLTDLQYIQTGRLAGKVNASPRIG